MLRYSQPMPLHILCGCISSVQKLSSVSMPDCGCFAKYTMQCLLDRHGKLVVQRHVPALHQNKFVCWIDQRLSIPKCRAQQAAPHTATPSPPPSLAWELIASSPDFHDPSDQTSTCSLKYSSCACALIGGTVSIPYLSC